MKNNTCVICGTTFEPRENKLYCSNSCRTKAYNEKKEKRNTDTVKQPEPEQILKKPNIIYKFDMSEYKELILIEGFKKLGFEMFCFVRKNLSGISNINDITDYFNEIYKNNLEEFYIQFEDIQSYEVNSMFKSQLKEYTSFLELFHSGQVEIFNSKNTKE